MKVYLGTPLMVRWDEDSEWEGPVVFLGEDDGHIRVLDNDGVASYWKYARLATPEEVEAGLDYAFVDLENDDG